MHANGKHAIGNGGNKATSSGKNIHELLTYYPSNKGDLAEKDRISCKAVRASVGNETCAPATNRSQSCSQRRLGWHDVPAGTVRKEDAEAFIREVLRKQCPDEIVIISLPPRPSRFQKLFPDRGGDAISEESDKKELGQEAAGAYSIKYRADLVAMSISRDRGVRDPTTGARPRCPWRAQGGAGGSILHSQPCSQNWYLDTAIKVADTPSTSARRRPRPNISLWPDDEDQIIENSPNPTPTAWVGIGTGPGNLSGKKRERWMVPDWRCHAAA